MITCNDLNNAFMLDELLKCAVSGRRFQFLQTIDRTLDGAEVRLSTDEMREVLGQDTPINSPEVLAWVREFLNGEE